MLKAFFTKLVLTVFWVVAAVSLHGQVTYTIRLEPDNVTFKVWMRSTTAYTMPFSQIPTAQVTVLVPHGTGANSFVVSNFQNHQASMQFNAMPSRVNAPTENTAVDYLSFGFLGTTSFNIAANTEIPLFSFQNSATCLGALSLINNATDPFSRLPNSANSNPGNAITILGKGGDAYSGNYGDAPNACTPPVAHFNTALSTVGTTTNIDILANDINPNGTAITDLTQITLPSVTTAPTKGTATVQANGSINYVPNTGTIGLDSFIYQICNKNAPTACDTAIVRISIGVQLLPRVYLAGCYDETADLMHDSLRRKSLIPLTQPYSATVYDDNVHNGTETTTSTVLNVTGSNAVVDWVIVELRNAADPTVIVAKRAALLQRDGDIVDVDGVSAVPFSNTSPASYFVTVKHRNHLGVMTLTAQALTVVPTVVDFTLTTTDNYKTTSLDKDYAQKLTSNAKRALWSGNIKKDNMIIFQGVDNEPSVLYTTVLTNPNNTVSLANYILTNYLRDDVDMDGTTIYQGPKNEVDKIFFQVLLHPVNTSYLYNFIINEQIPR